MKRYLKIAALVVALGLLWLLLSADGIRLPRAWPSAIALVGALWGGSALWELAKHEDRLRSHDWRLTQVRDEIARLRELVEALDADLWGMRANDSAPSDAVARLREIDEKIAAIRARDGKIA